MVEDTLESSSAGETETTPPPPAAAAKAAPAEKPSVDEVDSFPMKCRECGIVKKTVKGLKMHIKLMHLRIVLGRIANFDDSIHDLLVLVLYVY